ncbi:translation initiation factor eIF2B subunit gamma-like [Littorina saxatilis]|uniref:Translation initiation factor eIF2B subunit gamma n=1 Tax=Littorina saxatilis TaxID=31220 RepID=A0AAN9B9S3_9CAEN
MELIPVVMAAGEGSGMSQLTSQCPKALLTVGNCPMVYYPVSMLERHGFPEAIVVVPKMYEDEIRTALTDTCGVKMRLDFVSVPDLDEWGTAQMLRHVRSKIPESSDLLVVGCDLITDINLNHVLHMFRKKRASLVMLLSAIKDNVELPLPGAKVKGQSSRKDVIGMSEGLDRVLLVKTLADANKEEVFDPAVLTRYPRMRVRTSMTDCHLYLMKRWVLDYLAVHKDCEKMTSLKHDLLPHIVKKQFPSEARLQKSRAAWQKKPTDDDDELERPKRLLPVNKDNDIYAFAELYAACKVNSSDANLALALSGCHHRLDCVTGGSDADILDDEEDMLSPPDNDVIRCFAYVMDSGFCVRTNTLRAFCEANRQVSKVFSVLVPSNKGLVHPSVKLKKSSQVGPDCIVGEGTSLGEKVSVKKSVVGRNCVIQDKAKVVNSIIMDQVEIGQSSVVMNSIICTGALVAEMCELKDCIVAPSMSVHPLSKSNNEVISDVDRIME